LPKQLELMTLREKCIGQLVMRVGKESSGFRKPAMIVIGGYALRAFVPFARYSRDCDFALPHAKAWNIDTVAKWFPELAVEAHEHLEGFGYLRLIQLVPVGKSMVKVALDFMEGEIRGRGKEGLPIDDKFVSESEEADIGIGGEKITIRVPAYRDYFLLKLLSGRPSDVRDIVVMIWKRGTPDLQSLMHSAEETGVRERLPESLNLVVRDVSDSRFVDSWRGTFITQEFGEEDKKRVLADLRQLNNAFRG
jgi:hypothetical protein